MHIGDRMWCKTECKEVTKCKERTECKAEQNAKKEQNMTHNWMQKVGNCDAKKAVKRNRM